MWLTEHGTANLLADPILESVGFIISFYTKKNWVVFTSKGKRYIFKRDTMVGKGMPYIDRRKDKVGMAMVETVCKNFESYGKKDIEKATLSCTV